MSIHQALKSSGTGRVLMSNKSFSATGRSGSGGSSSASFELTFEKNGEIEISLSAIGFPEASEPSITSGDEGRFPGEWNSSVNNIYSIRVTNISGNQPNFSIGGSSRSLGVWHQIQNDAILEAAITNSGGNSVFRSGTFRVQIAFTSNTNSILGQADYSYFLQAETSTGGNFE